MSVRRVLEALRAVVERARHVPSAPILSQAMTLARTVLQATTVRRRALTRYCVRLAPTPALAIAAFAPSAPWDLTPSKEPPHALPVRLDRIVLRRIYSRGNVRRARTLRMEPMYAVSVQQASFVRQAAPAPR